MSWRCCILIAGLQDCTNCTKNFTCLMKCSFSVLTIIFAIKQNVIPFTHLGCWLGTAFLIRDLNWSPWSNKISSHRGRNLIAQATLTAPVWVNYIFVFSNVSLRGLNCLEAINFSLVNNEKFALAEN